MKHAVQCLIPGQILELILGLILSLAILPAAEAQNIILPMVGGNHPIPAPAVVGLTINPAAVVGGILPTATITLNVAPTNPNGNWVALTSNNAAAQLLVGSVTIPPGSTSATFTVPTIPVASQQVATLTAILNGNAQSTLTVNPPSVAGLQLNPGTVGGGSVVTGTVTLNDPAPSPNGSTVALSANNGAVQVTNVTVPAFYNSATFTVPTTSVASQQVATVTAMLNGTAQGMLTVDPPSASPHNVNLGWTASTNTDVAGYNIYRSTASYAIAMAGAPLYPSALVTAASVCNGSACGFNDNDFGLFDLVPGTTYYYVVTAVDSSGIESSNASAGQETNVTIP